MQKIILIFLLIITAFANAIAHKMFEKGLKFAFDNGSVDNYEKPLHPYLGLRLFRK